MSNNLFQDKVPSNMSCYQSDKLQKIKKASENHYFQMLLKELN